VTRRLDADLSIVRADMATHDGMGSSWDWEADLRFAQAIGDDGAATWADQLARSQMPLPLRLDLYTAHCGHITRRRRRAMGELVRRGWATASWIGLGEGSRAAFGVGRSRVYELTPVGSAADERESA
jgi:hypothetical protein